MNRKRGIFVALVGVFVVASLFVFASEQLFEDYAEWVYQDDFVNFDYTYALGVGEVDDDGDVCYDNPDEAKFGVLEQKKNNDGTLNIVFPSLQHVGTMCSWKGLPRF